MLNENAKQCVAALRSGEYPQGFGCMRDKDDRYCILGVFCEVYHQATGKLAPELYVYTGYYLYGGRGARLPFEVRDWVGLESCDGSYDDSVLSVDNDNRMSFAELADLIESEPQGLFVDTD